MTFTEVFTRYPLTDELGATLTDDLEVEVTWNDGSVSTFGLGTLPVRGQGD